MLRSLTLSPNASLFWFVAANVADSLSTRAALGMGSFEANPLMAWGMDSIGVDPTLALKVFASAVIGLVAIKIGKAHLLKWVTVVLVLIAVSNGLQVVLV